MAKKKRIEINWLDVTKSLVIILFYLIAIYLKLFKGE